MEQLKNEVKGLFERVQEYVNLRLRLGYMDVADNTSRILAGIASYLVPLIFAGLIVFFGSMAAAFIIGERLGSLSKGFLIMTLVYIGLFVIVLLVRKRLVEKPLTNIVLRIFFSQMNQKEQEKEDSDGDNH